MNTNFNDNDNVTYIIKDRSFYRGKFTITSDGATMRGIIAHAPIEKPTQLFEPAVTEKRFSFRMPRLVIQFA